MALSIERARSNRRSRLAPLCYERIMTSTRKGGVSSHLPIASLLDAHLERHVCFHLAVVRVALVEIFTRGASLLKEELNLIHGAVPVFCDDDVRDVLFCGVLL